MVDMTKASFKTLLLLMVIDAIIASVVAVVVNVIAVASAHVVLR